MLKVVSLFGKLQAICKSKRKQSRPNIHLKRASVRISASELASTIKHGAYNILQTDMSLKTQEIKYSEE